MFLFSAGFQSCFQEALRDFDAVLVAPQLDDGTRTFKDKALARTFKRCCLADSWIAMIRSPCLVCLQLDPV